MFFEIFWQTEKSFETFANILQFNRQHSDDAAEVNIGSCQTWFTPSIYGIAWYCMILCGMEWYCMILCGIAWFCVVSHYILWHCKILLILCGIATFWELSDLVYCSSLSTLSPLLHPASSPFQPPESPRLLLSRCQSSGDGFFKKAC